MIDLPPPKKRGPRQIHGMVTLRREQWRYILEWCDANADAELTEAEGQLAIGEPREAKKYFRKMRAWRELKTKINEVLR
jgi:hypothetical protein